MRSTASLSSQSKRPFQQTPLHLPQQTHFLEARSCDALQALPFYGEGTADLRTQLQEAVQDVIACMPVETQDEILDLDVSGNSELFVENLSSADYKLYSQATRAEKECLTTNG